MTETTVTGEDRDVLAGVLETAAVNPAVRIQDDLFRHVNGTWLAEAVIPSDKSSTGSFTLLRDGAEEACHEILTELAGQVDPAVVPTTPAGKVAALYATFMDEERIEALGAAPLEDELAPLLAAGDKEALARAVGAGTVSGFAGPFVAYVENDLNDPSRYTTVLSQSGLGLPDESYYREDAQEDVRTHYVAHVARMLALANAPALLGAESTELAGRVMALETALARGHWDRVSCRDIERINNPRRWEELMASAPGFPWEAWRAGIADAAEAAGASLGAFLQEAIVEQPDYLPHVAEVWQSTSLEDLRTWAVWHTVHGRSPLLSSAFVQETFSFYSQRLQGTDELRPRWKRGVSLVESCLGEALGEVYVERHFPPAHKEAMEALVADLIEAYRRSISELTWMGEQTRKQALDKLALFTPKIGYPVRWRDYSDVVVTPGDLMSSVRSVEAFDLARALRKLAGPVDRDEWHMTPQTVNAYYNPTMNEIVFPAAILQPPFFDPGADDAVNYAGIGAVIGHEIGHGFDDQGSTFDGTGKVTDWWTEKDRAAFTERTKALIAQYDTYVPADLAKRAEAEGTEAPHVNGSLTIGENIGDLGGLGIALKAYGLALKRAGVSSFAEAPVIDGLTAMERFFYSWARIWRSKSRIERSELLLTVDPHSPDEFRCNGIVRNMDAFHETFGVTEGDALWLAPEERVTIW
ncbi:MULTISPECIES: M13 family metallopeptidase [Actinomyces]|uniref:Peptidase M13 n=1 Tax=Actinomyces respiraculi TaxID=2744574 RepID=A0A7T0LLU8_9ACTO|nr:MULTISPECIES: M13-type metalloendopeptidase [Actinomyces]QPL06151.1 peptidase M13 [Actinomyces respiraculi]